MAETEVPRVGAGMIAPADLVRGKLIGTGGFGSVFEVLHKPSGQTFAMKIVPRCSLSEREVRCTYANAVPVYACFADATDVHIVMPFYRLGDLTGAGALSESMARCVAAQVADCLAGMHADGYVHRDVKRQNVLRDDSFDVTGRVVVADFGIVTHVTQATTQGRGTLDYMAPEVGMSEERERRLTTACDIFSLGVLLVAMALGREPRMRLGPPPFSMLPPTSVSCVCFRIRCAARVFESGGFSHPRAPPPVGAGFLELAGIGLEQYVTQLLTADVATPMSREYIDITLAALRRDPAQRPAAADIAQWLHNARPVPTPIPAAAAVAPPLSRLPAVPHAGDAPPSTQPAEPPHSGPPPDPLPATADRRHSPAAGTPSSPTSASPPPAGDVPPPAPPSDTPCAAAPSPPRGDGSDVGEMVAMGGSASTEASCLEAATRICEVAATEEGQRRLAREDVRGVLVRLGGRATSDEVRAAVAGAIRRIARLDEGAVMMSTEDVRGVLVGMGAECGSDDAREAVAHAISQLARIDAGRRLMARGDVRAVLVRIGHAAASDDARQFVAWAVRDVAGCEVGRRLMATEEVCGMLQAMFRLQAPGLARDDVAEANACVG